MSLSRGEKDLSIFGVVWVIVVGILVYALFFGAKPASAAPAVGP
jgi:hypothetical protein